MNPTINITCETDVRLNVTLTHQGEVIIPQLIDNLQAYLISGIGVRTPLQANVKDDYITIEVPWAKGRLGCHSLMLKGYINGLAWAAVGKAIIRYTSATEPGADSVNVQGDAYDVTMEVGYHYSDSPIARVEATIDSQVGEPEVDIRYAARVLSLAFRNIKGNGIADIIKDTDNKGDGAVNTWRIILDNGQQALISLANGSRGNGIASITPVSISQEDGGISTWSINMTDGRSTLITIQNGKTGSTGPQGATSVYDATTQEFLTTLETTTGQSQTTVMTQKAVTDELRNITDAVIKTKSISDIIYNAGRVNITNWNVKNDAENPSNGFYMNVVAYRGMRVKITPQSGKRVRVGFTQNILIKSGATTTGDYALVDGTSVSNGTAIVYADGYSDVVYPAANIVVDAVIPNNCNYLWCSYLYGSSGDIRPASIEFFESKTIHDINTELREVINTSAENISESAIAAAENSLGLVNFHPTTDKLGINTANNGYYIAKENGQWVWKTDTNSYCGKTLKWSSESIKGMLLLVVPEENHSAYIAFTKSSPVIEEYGVSAGDVVEFHEGWERIKVEKPTVFTIPTDEGDLNFFFMVKYNGNSCMQYYQRGYNLDHMIVDNSDRIHNLEYISITANEIADKTVKTGYRVVVTGAVNNVGTAGTAVLIPNAGYSKVSVDATYWTASIAAIAFFNNTNASKSTLISSVEIVSGTTHYEQDVPEGCMLIGFTYKTSSDSIDNIVLYIDTLDRIKNLDKSSLSSDGTLDRGTLLHQARAVSPTPVTLLHISDVHGNTQALQMIREFYEKYSEHIDDIINTGDLATNTYNTSDANNYYNLGYTDALFAIGNHDSATSTGSTKAEWIAAGRENCYNTYFANVGEWGVIQPEGAAENYLMYYHKDYAEAKVRLIVLDCMFISETGTTYSDDQYAWFRERLKETLLEDNAAYGFAVVVASHYIPGNYFSESLVRTNDDRVVSFHTGGSSSVSINSRFKIEKRFPQAVQDFIDGTGYFEINEEKGNFAIWLCGHHHSDFIAYAWTGFTDDVPNSGSPNPTEYETEYKITGVSGGQPVVESVQVPIKYPVSDILFSAITRAGGTAATREGNFVPAANAITITDTAIKIIRYGYTLTSSLRPMNVLVYNYKTKKVIENY